MLSQIEVRQIFGDIPGRRAETLARFEASDIHVQISGEQIMVFLDGKVRELPKQ